MPRCHRHDVVILGAGPAGCAAAIRLAQLDPALARDAVVLERARHPRDKGCAGGLTGRCAPLLESLGVPAAPGEARRATRIRLQHGDRSTLLVLRRPVPVVRRRELDQRLAERARGVVGALLEERPGRSMRRAGDRIEVRTDGACYQARVVIDASGSRCLSRRCGLLPRRPLPVPVWVAEGAPAPGEGGAEPELHFDFSEMARGAPGYYWRFDAQERGRPWVSRGFYPAAGLSASAGLEALRRRLRAHGVDADSVRPVAYPARLFAPHAATACPGVLTAGDAAGVDPLFGEGIGQALEGGILAAECAVRALRAAGGTTAFPPHAPLEGTPLGRRLRFLARMHDELYVPGYRRRLAFALGCAPFLRLAFRDADGGLPGPLVWGSMLVLALAARRFATLELDRPGERVVHL